MRLYRFLDEDKNIDVTLVTDGSCDQKKVFITESPRGITPKGNVTDPEGGAELLKLGFKWNVGEAVMHEELVAFAEEKGLELIIDPQGLNEIVAVTAEWNDADACVITIKTTVPAKKDVDIYFPNSVDLQESAERFGVIRGDRKTIATKVMSGKPMAFTLADLGLDAKEDLNVVVMTDNNTWREELVAELSDVQEVVEYVLETKEPTLNFPAKGGDDMCVVTSSKQTFKNGQPVGHPEGVPVTFSISGAGFKVDGGGQVTVDENPNNTARKAVVTVKQNESGKTLQITCNQAASTVTYEYALTVDPTAVTFDGAGGEKLVTVTSTRTKVLNGVKQQPETYPTDIELAGVWFDYEESGNNYNLKASENTGSSQRTGKATISQDGGKTAEVTLTQNAAIVTYDYALSANSQTIQFVALGETKSLQIVSTRQKKVNGKPSGGVEKVDTTAQITGTGFSQTSSETSNGENYSIVAAENTGAQRTGTAVVTAVEGGKEATVNLTQLAGA